MNTGGKVLFVFLVVAVVAAVLFSWKKYAIDKDYLIYATVACDPTLESGCFLAECDPEFESCDEPYYYKVVFRKAYTIPPCDAWGGQCPELSCEGVSEDQCRTVSCSPETQIELDTDDQCAE